MTTDNNILTPSAEDASLPSDSSPLPSQEKKDSAPVLALSADSEVETPQSREDTIWHELQNAYRTRKILTGHLSGMEQLEGGGTIAVVYYQEMRVVIPLSEMMIDLPNDQEHDYGEMVLRQRKILGNMLGAEIDFIVRGLDKATRSVVASRKEAMYKKRQIFYLPDATGHSRIYPDRVVQARVVAVAEKIIRVEVFGVETSIVARGLSWEWIGNARDHFNVGDRILVRVLKINRTDVEHLTIRVDARSVSATNSHDNLKKCMPQCRYAGRVTDVRNGVVFIRLNNGVNAIAHSCYDTRYPGKKDDVSFAVTRIDEEQGVAIGIITRIIKQNL